MQEYRSYYNHFWYEHMTWKEPNPAKKDSPEYPLLNLPVYAVLPLRFLWKILGVRVAVDGVWFELEESGIRGKIGPGGLHHCAWVSARRVRDGLLSIKKVDQAVEFLSEFGPIDLGIPAESKLPANAWLDLENKSYWEGPVAGRSSQNRRANISWEQLNSIKEALEANLLEKECGTGAYLQLRKFTWSRPLDFRVALPSFGFENSSEEWITDLDPDVTKKAFRSVGISIPSISAKKPDEILAEIWHYLQQIEDRGQKTKVAAELFRPWKAEKLIKRLKSTDPDFKAKSEQFERLQRQADAYVHRAVRGFHPWRLGEAGMPGILKYPTAFVSCIDAADALRVDLVLSRIAQSRWHRCAFAECNKVFERDSERVSKFCCEEHYRTHFKRASVIRRRERMLKEGATRKGKRP